jgi:thiol:disulfide interchange protein DsbD
VSRLLLLITLLLQLTPQIQWKSEVKETAGGQQIVLTGDLDAGIDHVTGTVTYMPCAGESCYMPVDWDFEEFFEAASESSGAKTAAPQKVKPAAPQQEDHGNLWALILEAILWGFAMLLTPCVFPMVPMTVSFFMKGSESPRQGRLKAFFYGLFIVLLYTVPISAIIGVTWLVGGSGVTADIFNWLSTHWLPNLIFFLVFMVFAASFFGAFEITLPSSWTNGADKNSDRKGLGGIFFLALTLVLVSFSCTGPIVGTVLIKSTQGEFWTPMVTMLAFSIAFALPFTVLALFPSLLKKLPKRGGWLNSVKVVLGFIEIALGLKFLSTADQTYHWHLLDREVYLAIWIAVFTLLGLYLIGKISFKHDTPLEYLSVPRLTLSIAVFAFVVYLLPGMWGAPLKALSGYLPPMETQDFVIREQIVAAPQVQQQSGTITVAHGLQAYDNLPDGLAAAKAAGKPVFLDFTGYGCVNCREMEARVWSDPEVLRRLRDDFVIVALHVDDKTKLPESAWVTNDKGNLLKDVGRVNSYIALHDFGVNAQPNYFLLDENGNRLAGPRPYNLDIQGFIDFLDTAL